VHISGSAALVAGGAAVFVRTDGTDGDSVAGAVAAQRFGLK
jgi:hypothetical protein